MKPNLVSMTAAAALAAVFVLGACGNDASRMKGSASEQTAGGPTQSYTVRGRIVTLPSADRPIDDLEIQHEAIPDYSDRDGKVYVNSKGVQGMSSMTMPFPVAEGVSLEGLKVGDPVEFTFVVTWGEDYPTYAVTKIATLPADTKLEIPGR
ncbi:MAG: copper-binding protein [Phycisphaerales bacterium]|nr:copper-binding protein [Phycisphaerales bacterium]